jgi:hypothetical protein
MDEPRGHQTYQKNATENENASKHESDEVVEGPIKRRWKEFSGANVDRHIELILAFAITFFAAGQWITSCQNNSSTSNQTAQLINAANINSGAAEKIAAASQRNATAAEGFATTAGKINSQMVDTVKKLNLQAGRLEESAKQTARLATDTEIANKQNVALFKLRNRPWVGVEGNAALKEYVAWVGAAGQAEVSKEAAEGKLPVDAIYHLRNSGDGPALNTILVVNPLTFYPATADDIYGQVDAAIEKSCQQGEQMIANRNGDLLLPGGEHATTVSFGVLDKKKFLFAPGCVVYKDIDGGLHHTRICYGAAMFVTPQPKALDSCGSRHDAD